MSKTRVEFINLRQAGAPPPVAAARLAAHYHAAGRRVLISARDLAEAQELDRALWTYDQDSFLPHALAGGPDQADEPVLVCHEPGNPNQAPVLILMHPVEPAPQPGVEVIILMIPAQDGPELQACRALYKETSAQDWAEVVHITALP